jgi:2,5-diamino-6-(ribosylamino)-4(3H)-pyrimidinone 5'-phosphate reductase
MPPKIILHNSVSLDGSFVNFEPHMGLHYQIAGHYRPEAHLIGSNTITKGIELYGDGVPVEEKSDFEKPERNKRLPYWVIVDTKGICKGLLHTCRRFEFCRDVIVLISEETSNDYIDFLEERNYDFHKVGQKHVDLKKSLQLLEEEYGAKTVLADTGRILGNLLLDLGLVSEISLLIHPVILGKKGVNLFSLIENHLKLELLKNEILDNNFVWLAYKVKH